MEQIRCAGAVAVVVAVVVFADVVGTPKGVVLTGGTQTIFAASEVFVAGTQRAGFNVLSDPIAETGHDRKPSWVDTVTLAFAVSTFSVFESPDVLVVVDALACVVVAVKPGNKEILIPAALIWLATVAGRGAH